MAETTASGITAPGDLAASGGITVRGWRAGDAGALAELSNSIERHGGAHPGWTADELTSWLDLHLADPDRDARLYHDPAGHLVAAGLVLLPPAGGHRLELLGGVHPQHRGRGLGRELFGWQLDRARALHRERAPGHDWEVDADARQADPSAAALFRRFGLAPTRYWFDMVARLPVPDAGPGVPAGFTVATYEPSDEAAVYAAHQEAFADHWGFQHREPEEWVPLTVGSSGFLPDLSLVAREGAEVAGYVLSYREDDPAVLYVGHVGVRRAYRRRGLAGGLLAEVLRRAAAQGEARLSVDAESPTGAVSVYERAGFIVESRVVTYSVSLPAET